MIKVSIVTVSFNSASTIRETIDSVLSQDYPGIDYIIVDGLSTDGTQEIVKSYGSRIAKFVSEKDAGLYDAMNKGISMATGEIIGILNSDDCYINSTIVSSVAQKFSAEGVDSVFGDLYYFMSSRREKKSRVYSGKSFSVNKVKYGMLPPHPTFFVRKAIYDKYGLFDLQFKYAADFDLMARFLYVHRISYAYLPIVMVRMRLGGLSTSSIGRIIEINREDLRSCKKNGIPTNFLVFHVKYFFKVFGIRRIFDLLRPSG